MKRWLKRLRGAIGMGITWAAGWAATGILIGVASLLFPGPVWNAFFEVFDAPLPALAVPGFVGGTLFSLVLGIAGNRRRFSELSLPTFTAWGALGGVLLSLVPAMLAGVGMASFNGGNAGLWRLTATISIPIILLSAASAAGTLMLARWSDGRGAASTVDDVTDDVPALEDEGAPDELGSGQADSRSHVHGAGEPVRVRHGNPQA